MEQSIIHVKDLDLYTSSFVIKDAGVSKSYVLNRTMLLSKVKTKHISALCCSAFSTFWKLPFTDKLTTQFFLSGLQFHANAEQ